MITILDNVSLSNKNLYRNLSKGYSKNLKLKIYKMFADLIISGYMLVALNTPSVFPLRNVAITEPQVSAKSVLIVDLKRDKVLFEKEPNEVFPIASLTKLLSTLVVLDAIPLDKIITFDQKAIDAFGEAGDFKAGEQVSARHLLFSGLIASSNRAMMALAYDLGLENFLTSMRSKAFGFGVKKITIMDPVGLSPQTSASAFEFLKIARAAFTNDFIAQILAIPEYSFKSTSGAYHKLISTNDLIFDPRIVEAKTGTLKEVGQNYAAVVKEGDTKLILIILGSSNRTKDTLSLLNWLDKGFFWR